MNEQLLKHANVKERLERLRKIWKGRTTKTIS